MIEQIGEHRVRHGNIMDGIAGLIPGGSVDCIYSDPPWGDGNLKYWQTMNEKTNRVPRRDTKLSAFINNIFDIIKEASHPGTVVFIEYGCQWVDVIHAQAQRIGLITQAISTPVYGSPARPLKLFTMTYKPFELPGNYTDTIDGTKGFDTLLAASTPFNLEGKKFLDPCCGLGYTAKLAIHHKGTFYGNELNAHRLERTKQRLRKDANL